jgi:hypothetical protein
VREQLPDLIAGVVVAAAFLIGLWIAYHRGFRAALPVRSGEFDFLATDLSLHDSRWRLEMENAAQPAERAESPPTLHLEQARSRLLGAGRRADGTAWQLEGIVHQRQAICLMQGQEADQPGPGLLMLRADAEGQTLTGYRIAWDGPGAMLSLREISLMRVAAAEIRGNALTPVT